MLVSVYNKSAEKVREVLLDSKIFGSKVNLQAMYLALKRQLASWRTGTASTKTRGEVRGGGRKPWRQKGTGRARHGSIRSPIWRKGGVVFGPKPRDFSLDLPFNMRRLALRGALTVKAGEGKCFLIDAFPMDKASTKEVAGFLKKVGIAGKKVLFIIKGDEKFFSLSARNIDGVKVLKWSNMNIYDLLKYEYLIFFQEALDKLVEGY